jgi:hypothetical protein
LGIPFQVSGFGFRVSDLGFRVPGLGSRVLGFGLRVSGFGFRIPGFGFRVLGFGFRSQGLALPRRPAPGVDFGVYRGTSLIRNSTPLGHYGRTMPRALWWCQGCVLFLMSEVPRQSFRAYSVGLRGSSLGCSAQRRGGKPPCIMPPGGPGGIPRPMPWLGDWGLRIGDWGLGIGVQGAGFRVQGSGYRV